MVLLGAQRPFERGEYLQGHARRLYASVTDRARVAVALLATKIGVATRTGCPSARQGDKAGREGSGGAVSGRWVCSSLRIAAFAHVVPARLAVMAHARDARYVHRPATRARTSRRVDWPLDHFDFLTPVEGPQFSEL